MRLPLRVTFRNVDASPALRARIQELAGRLDRFSAQIMRCHVTVEAPHRHSRQGRLYQVRIDLTVPQREIAVRRAHPIDRSHEDPYVALRDAFQALRRRLQDFERRRQLKVKAHTALPRRNSLRLKP